MNHPEHVLRELWTRQGVDPTRQEEILAILDRKAQPGAWVGPFQIPPDVHEKMNERPSGEIAPDTICVNQEDEARTEQLPIPSLSIANLLQQRDAILTLFQDALDTLTQAHALAENARLGFPDLSLSRDWRGHGMHMTGEFARSADLLESFRACVDAGGWETLIKDSGLRSLMSAATRKEIVEAIHNKTVPALTREAIVTTFRTLHASRGDMFAQGVIECFKHLSWHYTTNLPQKFGTRIVVTCLTSYGSGNVRQCDELDDLLRVFHVCDGKAEADHRRSTYHLISQAMQATTVWPKHAENEYWSNRLFKNQNGHVTFKRPDLVKRLNHIIAEHFPNTLPAPKHSR